RCARIRHQRSPPGSGPGPPGQDLHRPHAGFCRGTPPQHPPRSRPGAGTGPVFGDRSGMSVASTLRNPHAPFSPALQSSLDANVERALAEDVGTGDLTGLLIPGEQVEAAQVIVREPAVLCGAPWFEAVMHRVDKHILLDWAYAEGDFVQGAHLE